ncbi:MAG: hypothetical protein RL120_07460 [Gammaproteobacteria bacterium]
MTTHRDRNGATVWYLGGELAETGIGRSDDDQVATARALLQRFLPWIDIRGGSFSCLDIARAEPDLGNGYRPDDAYFAEHGNVIAAWPTKLTLAPSLADKVIEQLQGKSFAPGSANAAAPLGLPSASLASQPWNLN